jgi:hypothetical protein
VLRETDVMRDRISAIEHLYALTFGQVNSKSMLGTIALTEAAAERIITSGVRAFTRAYAPAEARSAASARRRPGWPARVYQRRPIISNVRYL